MSTVQIPDYQTDPFFGLEDKWIETAEGELTHYHEVGEGTPILFLHGSGTGVSAAAKLVVKPCHKLVSKHVVSPLIPLVMAKLWLHRVLNMVSVPG